MAGEASCNNPAAPSSLYAGAAAAAVAARVVGEVLTAGMAVSIIADEDGAPPVTPVPGADDVVEVMREGKIDN